MDTCPNIPVGVPRFQKLGQSVVCIRKRPGLPDATVERLTQRCATLASRPASSSLNGQRPGEQDAPTGQMLDRAAVQQLTRETGALVGVSPGFVEGGGWPPDHSDFPIWVVAVPVQS